tara:strand:+ start:250 stop:399 length:150 start_codon:yes stop_codon:yes gene_type:complete
MPTPFSTKRHALKKAASCGENLPVNPFMHASVLIVIRRSTWKKEIKSII